jgi:hypothetical protein
MCQLRTSRGGSETNGGEDIARWRSSCGKDSVYYSNGAWLTQVYDAAWPAPLYYKGYLGYVYDVSGLDSALLFRYE